MNNTIRRVACALTVVILACPIGRADYTDYTGSQNTQFSENTGSRDSRIDSQRSVASPGAQRSGIDDYRQMDDQLNLTPGSGNTVILRTDQKIGLNQFVPHLIPIKNLTASGVRELRPIARRICGFEGGHAQVVVDNKTGDRFVQITCTPYQLPFVQEAIEALDQRWLTSTGDGEGERVYKAYFRDINAIDRLVRNYTGGRSQIDNEDNAVIHSNTRSYASEYVRVAGEVDIPEHEITVNAKFYEVTTNNDLKLGLDYIAWKNDLGWNLFEFGMSYFTFNGVGNFDNYYGYNAVVTSAYYDFLSIKGKARVLADATVQTASGSIGEWLAMDPVQTITVSGSIEGGGRPEIAPPGFDRDALIDFALEHLGDYNANGIWIPLYSRQELELATTDYILGILEDKYHAAFVDALRSNLETPGVIHYAQDYDRFLDYRNHGRIGLSLVVLPVVGLESTEMFIRADSASLDGYTPTGEPIISQSQVKTTVRVRDGEKLVLAGLSRTEKVVQKSGMPWLGDLPLLGYLFSGETKVDRTKRILIVLETTISAGLVDPSTDRPLSLEEVARLKSQNPFGDMKPRSMPLPNDLELVRYQAEGAGELRPPYNPFGFDQWLLDPEKAGYGDTVNEDIPPPGVIEPSPENATADDAVVRPATAEAPEAPEATKGAQQEIKPPPARRDATTASVGKQAKADTSAWQVRLADRSAGDRESASNVARGR